ncbi:MAG: hypothetical protein C0600_03150 [Ignavibacteria bacterium]|nr:MAG: hypothetical protein C0600_03150 [Ignavibacteria bacterium]
MQRSRIMFMIIVCCACAIQLNGQVYFETSLHATRQGKVHWYESGFYLLTSVDIKDLGCTSCHGPTDADGNAYTGEYKPGCVDCHPTGDFSREALTEQQCLGCHGRQNAEINSLGLKDVHRDEGVECWDCHKATEIHGEETGHVSMWEAGAITAYCTDCHSRLPEGHDQYDPHAGKLHCSACHTSTVITCYNCHFESQVQSHVKRAKQTLSGFVMLVNREKDGKVGTASFQSLTWQGKSFVAFAPYHAHAIEEEGRRCGACHLNLGGSNTAIEEYNSTGRIQFASWNVSDSTLSWLRGVVPIPSDYTQSLKMDFITYNGSTADPAGPSANWSLIGAEWTAQHMLYATPLTTAQMAKLGMTATDVDRVGPAESFALQQNYPNPFNPSTTIVYSVGRAGNVMLTVSDTQGRIVRTLVAQHQDAGRYSVVLNADDLRSGVYLLHLEAGSFRSTKKMLLLR